MNEADLIAAAPTLNTTAETAAKLANNWNFRPDYIIEYPEPDAKRKWAKSGKAWEPAEPSQPSMPPPQLTYQIV